MATSSALTSGYVLSLSFALALTGACAPAQPPAHGEVCPPAAAATPAPAIAATGAATTPAPAPTETAAVAPTPTATPTPAPDATPAPAASAPAAPAGPPALPKPSPELDRFMKDILGNWKCTATFPAGGFGPGSPETKTESSVKFSKAEAALEGFFYKAEYSMPKSKTVPFSLAAIFYLGYDNASKQITNVAVDSVGGFQSGMGPLNEGSASWTATVNVMGGKHTLRETLTKVGPKELTHKAEIDMGKGFQVTAVDTCKK